MPDCFSATLAKYRKSTNSQPVTGLFSMFFQFLKWMIFSTWHDTISELKKRHVRIGMTQSGDPIGNAIAERAKGILKVEWLYKMIIATRDECLAVLDRIIDFYNTQRSHMNIGRQTPTVNPVSDLVNQISLTALKVLTIFREGQNKIP